MATGTAILIGSAVAALGAVGAAGVNAASQSSTNKSQEDMFRQQMAYQTSEREAAQQYNTPVNQRKRFEVAGVNPYFALSNIDSGITTAQSAPGAPTLQAPQYGDILGALTDAIPQGINNYQGFEQSQQLQLGIEQMKVDTRYKLTQKLMDIVEQRVRIQGSKLSNDAKSKELSLLDKQAERLQQDIDATTQDWTEQRKTVVAQRKRAELEADAQQLENDYKAFFNELQKKLGDKQVELLKAEISNQLSQVNVNNKNAANIVADTAIKKAQEKGVRIDNFQKNKINWMLREGIRLDNHAKKLNIKYPSVPAKIFGIPFNDGEGNLMKSSYEQGRRRGYSAGYNQGYINAGKH